MKKSLRTTLMKPRHTKATQRGRQRSQKPSWREEGVDIWRKIIGEANPTTTPPHRPPWIDTGTHTFELTGQKTGDTAYDDEIAMQTLKNDRDCYDATIFTDAATHGSPNGGSSIIITQVTVESTVRALSLPVDDARPSKPKRKL